MCVNWNQNSSNYIRDEIHPRAEKGTKTGLKWFFVRIIFQQGPSVIGVALSSVEKFQCIYRPRLSPNMQICRPWF